MFSELSEHESSHGCTNKFQGCEGQTHVASNSCIPSNSPSAALVSYWFGNPEGPEYLVDNIRHENIGKI